MNRTACAVPLVLLLALGGCLHIPTAEPVLEVEPPVSHSMPLACRGHVHVVMLDGFDAVNWHGFATLAHDLHDFGYANVRHGYLYHAPFFAAAIRCLKDDPDPQLVLVAHGSGASGLAYLADTAREAEVPVAAVVYYNPCWLGSKVATAERTAVVTTKEPPAELLMVDGVEVLKAETPATAQATLRTLLDHELALAASHVPVSAGWLVDPEKSFEPAPVPRTITERLPPPKGWEFVQPE